MNQLPQIISRVNKAACLQAFLGLLMLVCGAMTATAAENGEPGLEFKRKVSDMFQFAQEMQNNGFGPDQEITVTIPGKVFQPPRQMPIISRDKAAYTTPAEAAISWWNANVADDLEWRKEAIHPTEVATIKGKPETPVGHSSTAIHGIARFHDLFIFFLSTKSEYSTDDSFHYAIVIKTDKGYRFTRTAYKIDRMENIKLYDIITKNFIHYEDTRGKLFPTTLTPEPTASTATSASAPAEPATTQPASGTAVAAVAEEPIEETSADLTLVVKGVNSAGYPLLSMTNNESRDIDDIMGGVSIYDADGTVLFSSGVNDWVTGSVYLKAGETKDLSLYVTPAAQDRNPRGKELLHESPESLTATFEVKKVTFMRPQ